MRQRVLSIKFEKDGECIKVGKGVRVENFKVDRHLGVCCLGRKYKIKEEGHLGRKFRAFQVREV
jgi:hypothetical protein